MKKKSGIWLCSLFLLTACVKDKPHTPSTPPPGITGRKVFIANEGSLGNGNASLSVYDTDRDSLYNDVFSGKNGQPLGDVFQSMVVMGDRLYMAINNSDKIVVIDKNTCALLGEIPVRKPRYMLPVSDTKMYVSSLFYPEINIVNPQTFQTTGKITVDFPNTEGLQLLNGKVYACNWDTACNYIYQIDPVTDHLTARIPVAGYAPQQLDADKDGKLWVVSGNTAKGKKAWLTQVDPGTRSILKSFSFPDGADVMKPVFNPSRDTLYYLEVNYDGGTDHNGVYRIPVQATTAPGQAFIAAQPLQYFWGLGIDPVKNLIYVGDPKGFIQAGAIAIYTPAGILLKTLSAGIGPGFFYFEP